MCFDISCHYDAEFKFIFNCRKAVSVVFPLKKYKQTAATHFHPNGVILELSE